MARFRPVSVRFHRFSPVSRLSANPIDGHEVHRVHHSSSVFFRFRPFSAQLTPFAAFSQSDGRKCGPSSQNDSKMTLRYLVSIGSNNILTLFLICSNHETARKRKTYQNEEVCCHFDYSRRCPTKSIKLFPSVLRL
jgi:hypothetical protein